ncbi:hypothetical protein QAD02_004173 [Eretmocerus hayati]|uniref:Uncharacterized protein n=1 Tax=Eretmocerus hayati TaxID=131215 RepID=A0ACC2NRR2_9HYME|nr:hypothetical protein QAD02_004173 [Eretmocerus hayati]
MSQTDANLSRRQGCNVGQWLACFYLMPPVFPELSEGSALYQTANSVIMYYARRDAQLRRKSKATAVADNTKASSSPPLDGRVNFARYMITYSDRGAAGARMAWYTHYCCCTDKISDLGCKLWV